MHLLHWELCVLECVERKEVDFMTESHKTRQISSQNKKNKTLDFSI